MKKIILNIFLPALFSCLFFYACITEYNATGINEVGDILVVEGIITDNETCITLSKSVNLKGDEWNITTAISNARVYVECDDGSKTIAEPDIATNWKGQYFIKTGKLDLAHKYCLKIEIDEQENSSGGDWSSAPTKTYEYCSDYSYPIETPQIDSIFWKKRGIRQPVTIYVSTHDEWNRVLYYRWSFEEDWEVHSEVYYYPYTYYCWNSAKNTELLLGSTEQTVFGRLTDIITEMSCDSKKLKELYRITVKQNAISKKAYNYFTNIEKNAKQAGSIFSPIPSELRGNITCVTDPGRPVIGYVDVSTTTKNHMFITEADGVYEEIFNYDIGCGFFTADSLRKLYPEIAPNLPNNYIQYNTSSPPTPPILYVKIDCVDCSWEGNASTNRPDDWPNTEIE